ncbi:cell division cycle protein 48 [Tanacetum coccineum]
MEEMKRGVESIIKHYFSRGDQQTVSDLAYQINLYFHAYSKGKSLPVSKVPLPNYRADYDERHGYICIQKPTEELKICRIVRTNSAKKALSVKLKERQKKQKVLDEGITNSFDNKEKMEVIDLEDNSIDDVILNSMTIVNEYFQIALRTRNPYALRDTVVEVPNYSWDDIGGLENVKHVLQEHLENIKKFGISPSKGVLFYGPPGCVRLKPMFVKYYDKTHGSALCILIFDELDSIATQVIHCSVPALFSLPFTNSVIKYVVPTGKDNFIVSAGRPNMVPAGRTIVSPGSIIVDPVVSDATVFLRYVATDLFA